jgi:hypothetical protein
MATVVHTALPRVISLFAILALAGMKFAHADALTGEMQDDAKDLLPPSAQPPPSTPACGDGVDFVPLPRWARGVVLGPTPDVLKPMGRKVVLTVPPTPAPEPLAPPKDNGSTVVVGKPLVVIPGPATPPAPSPALIAVSPFLDWIKANPQAAAEKARLQAGTYQAAADPNATASTSTTTLPGVNGAGPAVVAPAPYWMPPLIDSASFGNGNVNGSSAAIYSTPQR